MEPTNGVSEILLLKLRRAVDENLTKVAKLQGVDVLNIHELD